MPLAFDGAAGSATANSYVALSDAVAYFEARMNTGPWDAADQSTRERALAAATQRLEQELYVGVRATAAQRLKWPRSYAPDPDNRAASIGTVDAPTGGWAYYPNDAVPRPVQEAASELALVLLAGSGTDPLALTGLEGFERLAVGSLDITPRVDAPVPGALPPQVLRLLRGLLTTSTGTTRLVRG